MSPTQRQAMAEAARFERGSSAFPWPLPLAGIFSQARTAEIPGTIAERADNLWSDGVSLYVRDGYAYDPNIVTGVKQRIPYEFGAAPHYIEVRTTGARAGAATFARAFPGRCMAAGLSNNVILADGHGEPLRYDGTTIQVAAFTTLAGEPAPSTFDGVIAHHDRVYFWDSDAGTPDFFYCTEVGGVLGPLVRFPLTMLGNVKGSIVAMHSFTVDAGQGTNDVLVIITSTGQAIVYEGLDPSDGLDWRLFGRFSMAPPLGRFACASFGPDSYVLTKQGVLSMRAVLQQGAASLAAPLTRRISKDIAAAAKAYGHLEGWQLVVDPLGKFLVVSVPDGNAFSQHVFGFEAQGWFRWTGIPSIEWHALVDRLDFTATDGRLATLGAAGDDGAAIEWTYASSWTRTRKGSSLECVTPSIIATGDLSITLTVLADHNETATDIAEATQSKTFSPETGSESVPQTIDEPIPVGMPGTVFKMILSGSQVSGEILALTVEV